MHWTDRTNKQGGTAETTSCLCANIKARLCIKAVQTQYLVVGQNLINQQISLHIPAEECLNCWELKALNMKVKVKAIILYRSHISYSYQQ